MATTDVFDRLREWQKLEMTSADWYCPTCSVVVPSAEVTHDDRHETCGTDLSGFIITFGLCAADVDAILAVKALADRRGEVLRDWLESTEHLDRDPPVDPVYYPAVLRVMASSGLTGFGAMMTTCQRLWRESLQAGFGVPGGEFVAGPCRTTLQGLLRRTRAALTDDNPAG